MKKQILFVDDEPYVLHGLERMLRHRRNEWELVFVGSGAQALARMNQGHFDVVIADMVMPDMNGAELLGTIQRRFPSTARFVLSGHADPQYVFNCVGVAHQYLAKPCEIEALESIIGRAASLQQTLSVEPLRDLISQMDRLPSIPSVYVEVIRKLRNPDVAMEEIAAVISTDLAMTAKILKLVNSAFFGPPREICNVVEAVIFLGLDLIKALVLSINAFSQFETVKLGGITLEGLWHHSLSTAAAAKQIARLERPERNLLEASFVGGLLHDTGKLILASNFPSQYAQAVKLAQSERLVLWQAEQQIFRATHADVGGYLLGLWGLPASVVDAITSHHQPSRSIQRVFTPLTAVHVADVLIQENRDSAGSIPPPPLDEAFLDSLGMADRVDSWRKQLAQCSS